MTENKYAVTGWAVQGDQQYDLQLPSGQLCLVRKLEMERIVELGIMDALDTFTNQIPMDNKKKSKKVQEGDEARAFMDMLKNKEAFAKLQNTVNTVVMDCVVQPKIHALPETNPDGDELEPRDPTAVYIDALKFSDKMAIFQDVFDGMGEMSAFRPGQTDPVGTMAEVTSAPVQTK